MGICASNCSVLIPPPPAGGCGTTQRSGGISRVVFAACSVRFTDIGNLAEWCDYVYRGLIVSTGLITGQKARDTAVTARFDSCSAETTTGFTRSLTYNDFNADNEENRDYDFYNRIQAGPQNYRVGFITCDGAFTGWIDEFSIDADYVIPETNNEYSRWEVAIGWQGLEMPKPIYIAGLQDAVTGRCEEVPGFYSCDIVPDPLSITPALGTLCQLGGIELSVPYNIQATYQWFLGGTAIPYATGNTYVATEAGSYTVDVDDQCSVVSSAATVITDAPSRPSITSITPVFGPGGYTVTIVATGANLRYRLIAPNGYTSPWQTSNVFTYVHSGVHIFQVQDASTTCTAEESRTL